MYNSTKMGDWVDLRIMSYIYYNQLSTINHTIRNLLEPFQFTHMTIAIIITDGRGLSNETCCELLLKSKVMLY